MGSAVHEHYIGDKMMNEQYSPYFKNGMRESSKKSYKKNSGGRNYGYRHSRLLAIIKEYYE